MYNVIIKTKKGRFHRYMNVSNYEVLLNQYFYKFAYMNVFDAATRKQIYAFTQQNNPLLTGIKTKNVDYESKGSISKRLKDIQEQNKYVSPMALALDVVHQLSFDELVQLNRVISALYQRKKATKY